jgi:3'-phosphoadenosine 5'-phosphosulfate sulfotransferase (PAPS reductase)/FAD synthetase
MSNYALFSGGHDSVVSTHKVMSEEKADTVLHIDTGIGIPETQQYVKETCQNYGWELDIVASDFNYRDIVLENGFPGPGVHIIMYSKLKERALRKVARRHDGKPHFWTGVRSDESDRRFRNVTERVKEDSQWFWHSPIREMTESDVLDYIEQHEIEKNPVKQLYHHSGECLCGAFGNRPEELVLLEAHYPKTADRIKDLEDEVQQRHGYGKKSYWAHGDTDDKLIAAEHPDQMPLCTSCGDW